MDENNQIHKNKAIKLLEKLQEITLILSAIFAIFILLSLYSFSPTDPSWSQTGFSQKVENVTGSVGAFVADLLFFSFGLISYVLPFSIIYFGYLLSYKKIDFDDLDFLAISLRLIGLLLTCFGINGLASLNFNDFYHYSAGGAIGEIIVYSFIPLFGLLGTTLLLLTLSFIGFTLGLNLSWGQIAEKIGSLSLKFSEFVVNTYKNFTKPKTSFDDSNQEEKEDRVANLTQINNNEFFQKQISLDNDIKKNIAEVDKEDPEYKEQRTNNQEKTNSTIKEKINNINNTFSNIVKKTAKNNQNEQPITRKEPMIFASNQDLDAYEIENNIGQNNLQSNQIEPNNQIIQTQDQQTQVDETDQEQNLLKEEVQSIDEYEEIQSKNLLATQDNQTNNFQEQKINQTKNVQNITKSQIEQDSLEPKKESMQEYLSRKQEQQEQQEKENEQQILEDQNQEQAGKNNFNYENLEDITFPEFDLLNKKLENNEPIDQEHLQELAKAVEMKLSDFGLKAKVVGIYPGPVVTRFELDLAAGIKVAKIVTLAKDLARSLLAPSVRIVEVIPGKSYVGIEIPNRHRQIVNLSQALISPNFKHAKEPLTMALGADISGNPVIVNLAKMPHLLVAGTTGSGKSVGVNAMIMSMLYKSKPDDLRFIMVDPKMLELSVYEGIPHLLTPVITDMKKAETALKWCVDEMERRYKLMSVLGVRNLDSFNEKILKAKESQNPIVDPLWNIEITEKTQAPTLDKLPNIVVVVDEFADLMMIVGKKVDELIARIAQKARAAGIHLILATQRPSVDVITGLIKANIPTRIGFSVSSKIDSRTILDQQGAEQLLGHGDMLYLPSGTSIPTRVHGAFVTDEEVHKVVASWSQKLKPKYIESVLHEKVLESAKTPKKDDGFVDVLYDEAINFVVETQKGSISSVQRKFKIGYNRAARIIEQMEVDKIVSAPNSNGNRNVLVENEQTSL